MDWSKGYTAEYYLSIIDPATWRDIGRIEILGGSIKRDLDGLRESASVEVKTKPEGIEQWVRIWLDVKQDGATDHVALFTGLATTPRDQLNGVIRNNTLDCYSVLKPVNDVDLLRGWYAPAGTPGAAVIENLLSVTPAPVYAAENAPILQSNIIADDDETRLTMIDKILTAINWRLRVNGDGSITIEPKPDTATATLDPLEYDVIEQEVNIEADLFNCPNVFLAIDDDLTAIARDDSPDSPLSTVNRGREVWARDTSCELADNETIEQYALRRLREEQKVEKKASYNRRFIPDLTVGDLVRLHYPEQGLDGLFTVRSQGIDLSFSARTNEEIEWKTN